MNGSDVTFGETEILTDDYGVSHVYGDNLYSVAYANGYVQARDRLFQMDVLRHVGKGDSASVVGPSQVESDVSVSRDLYSQEELKEMFEDANETTRTAIRAFADGVNRKIEEMEDEGYPGEFSMLGHEPEPWEPTDTVGIIGYLMGFFGFDGGGELGNARRFAAMKRSLGDERQAFETYADLNWLRASDGHPASIPEEELVRDAGEELPEYDDVPDEQLRYVDAALGAEPWGIGDGVSLAGSIVEGVRGGAGILEGFEWGSNAAVVGGEHTETGSPIMFSAPQMGYYKPPVVYEVGLHGDGFDVAGVGVVGTPGVVIGRTPEFAWGVTSGRDDQIDTLVVELHPEDRHRYRWEGEWHEMETRTVEHNPSVRGGLLESEFGPGRVEQEVARIHEEGEVMPVVAWNEDENVAWCQRTMTRGEELNSVFSWVEIGRQDGYEGFVNCLEEFAFSFNFHYADDESIAFVHTGKVPERRDRVDPRLPVPADEYGWKGARQGTELGISVKDPDQGYVVNWNNAPVKGWSSGDTEQEWGNAHRVEVLERYLRKKIEETDGSLRIDDLESVIEESATHDPVAPHSTPFFVKAARGCGGTLERMADELEEWSETEYAWWDVGDGRYHPGHAIWEETRRELQEIVFGDVLGDETPQLIFDPPDETDSDLTEDPHAGDRGRLLRETAFVDALKGETRYDWLGDDPEATVRRAMRRARDRLAERFGSPHPRDWKMEERETGFVSLGAAREESIGMVNRGTWTQVVCLGTGEGRCVLPPSNNGHVPLTELPRAQAGYEPNRLRDQMAMYQRFGYKPFPVTRRVVKENSESEYTLSESRTERPNPGVKALERLLGSR